MAQLWDILADGGEHRSIIQVNGNGNLGLAIGVDIEDEYDVEKGDVVGLEPDKDEQSLTIYFSPNRS